MAAEVVPSVREEKRKQGAMATVARAAARAAVRAVAARAAAKVVAIRARAARPAEAAVAC